MLKTFFAAFAVLAFIWTPLGRTSQSDSISGKWHFVFDTPGGDRVFDSVLEQTDDKVTGKWAVGEGHDGDPIAGTYTAKKLNLEFTANSPEVGPGTMKLKGQLGDDGTLTGDWSFLEYEGTFKATRVKDEPAKP
jgi:hypothetical protein